MSPIDRRLVASGALALALWPAAALANPGPNPLSTMAFMALGGLEVCASVALQVAVGRSPRGSSLLASTAGLLSFLGLSAMCWWPLSLGLQLPAALFILLASRTVAQSWLRVAGVLTACCAALLTAYGTYMAHQRRDLFGLSAATLGAEVRPRDAGRRLTLDPFPSADAGEDDAGSTRWRGGR